MPPSYNAPEPSEFEMDITEGQLASSLIQDASESDTKTYKSHSSEQTIADTRSPCRFFAQQKCNKGDSCPFSHDIASVSEAAPKQPCRNMMTTGQCSWGSACMFDHSMQVPQKLPSIVTSPHRVPPLCNYFVQGRCSKGQACTFSHTQPGLVGYMPSATGAPQYGVFIPLQATMFAAPPSAALPQSVIPLSTPPNNQKPYSPSPSSQFTKTGSCRYYAEGTCRRGNSCTYIHDEPRDGPRKREEPMPLEYNFDGEWGATSWDENANGGADPTTAEDGWQYNNEGDEPWPEEEKEAGAEEGTGWDEAAPDEWNAGNEENNEEDAAPASPISDGGWGASAPTPWDVDDLPAQTTPLPNRASDAQPKRLDSTGQPSASANAPSSSKREKAASSKPEKKLCGFYKRGTCRKGSKCNFVHEQSSASSVQSKEAPPHTEIKFAKPCRYYREGKCEREDCRFSHTLGGQESVTSNNSEGVNEAVENWRADVDPEAAPAEMTPVEMTPAVSERNLVLSSPPPGADVTHDHELVHRPKSFERKINQCTVLIMDGCKIQKLTTVYESTIIHLSQLPTGMTPSGLKSHITKTVPGVEVKSCEMKNIPGKAIATFVNPVQAAMAARSLNNTLVQGRTITVALSTQTGTMAYLSDTTVRITYKAPELHSFVYFPNVETARATLRVDRFKDNRPINFRNYTIQVHYESPGKRMSPAQPWHLVIKGLRLDSEDDREAIKSELLRLFIPYNATSVQIGQPSYSNEAPRSQILDLLRFKIGSLEDFEVLFPVNFQSSERRTAFATFSNRNDATKAVQELDRYSQPNFLDSSVKKNTLRVFTAVLTKNRMPAQKYSAIEDALSRLFPPGGKTHLHVTLDDRGEAKDPNVRVVYVSTSNTTEAIEMNRQLHSLLAGAVLKDEKGDIIWDKAFADNKGLSFFQELNDSNPAAFVQCDVPRSCVRLFGDEEALEPVRRELERITTKPDIFSLSPSQIDALLAGGLTQIRQNVGVHTVLDVYGKRLLVPFSFARIDSEDTHPPVEELISAAEEEYQESHDVGIRHCILCSSLEGPLITLSSCDHRFHYSCLKQTILSVISLNSAFTLRCPAAVALEGCTCDTAISTQVIHLLLDEEEQMALFTASAERYIRDHGDIFKLCPTPTCPGVYRADEDRWWTMRRCAWCWVAFCASCGVRAHDGYTCTAYKAKFASLP